MTIRVSPEQGDYLEMLARRYRVSVGEVMRRLIEQERDLEASNDLERPVSSYSRFDRRPRRRASTLARDDLDLDHLELDLGDISPSSEPEPPVFRRSEQR